MYISVQLVVDSCDYELTYFHKILTRNGIRNHLFLSVDDLLKLYYNEKVTSTKALVLKVYLEELLFSTLGLDRALQRVTV